MVFSLENSPTGAAINQNNGMFSWTPNDTQGGKSYTFDIAADLGSLNDRQSITIAVNDVLKNSEPAKEPEPAKDPGKEPAKESKIASFVDTTRDPQSYVDRYNNEPSYKKWFDANFPEYSSIYEAVGLDEPKTDTPKTDTPKTEEPKFGICGSGTKLIDGICTIIDMPKPKLKPWWQFW